MSSCDVYVCMRVWCLHCVCEVVVHLSAVLCYAVIVIIILKCCAVLCCAVLVSGEQQRGRPLEAD